MIVYLSFFPLPPPLFFLSFSLSSEVIIIINIFPNKDPTPDQDN